MIFVKVVSILYLVSCAYAGDRFLRPEFNQARFGGIGGLETAAASVDEYYPPQPYSFGYNNVDEYGDKQFHKEQGDANNVKTGSYGYTDANGLYRRVNYIADANGFRATVETNEPGTKAGSSADVAFNANPVVAQPGLAKAAAYGAPAYAKLGGHGYGHHGHDQAAYHAGYGHH